MFYGAFVLAKKGPLAKVWLAAHWDKKLTKAHVFETDVESTVDSIISPQVKMALRTSGHLLLGVVRIYSRKQKYLIHDLGEACAKIKMAFRPGIVDLPSNTGAENADAITLPEIFHDFENAVADMGALDLEAQFTINPSRVSEITMADDITNTGDGDIFGREFGEFDMNGGDFEGGMEDIEVPRNPKGIDFGDVGAVADNDSLQVSDLTNGINEPSGLKRDYTIEGRLPDAANDFGDGFLGGDGFGLMDGEFDDLPQVPGLDLDGEGLDGIKDAEAATSKAPDNQVEEETAMEVDPPQRQKTPDEEQPSLVEGEGDQTLVAPVIPVEEEGFVLDPVEVTGIEEKRAKRKRRLVVDNDKEFTGQQIKSQFEDYKDLLQPKCFPPPTKKAMVWKEMAGCDQLYSNPTAPMISAELVSIITRNYNLDIPGEPAPELLIELDNIATEVNRDMSNDLSDIEVPRGESVPKDITGVDVSVPKVDISDEGVKEPDLNQVGGLDFGDLGDEMRPFDMDNGLGGGMDAPGEFPDNSTSMAAKDISDVLDIGELPTQSTDEQQSNEMSEEFEQRRWTKRTQQVLRVLQRTLTDSNDINFNSLTQRCNRKQAASRFYTCLLLAKEGMINIHQPEPFAEMSLQKGPKFIEAV